MPPAYDGFYSTPNLVQYTAIQQNAVTIYNGQSALVRLTHFDRRSYIIKWLCSHISFCNKMDNTERVRTPALHRAHQSAQRNHYKTINIIQWYFFILL